MKDADSVALLQWAAPRLGLRWLGLPCGIYRRREGS
jgi:hypothetical protein